MRFLSVVFILFLQWNILYARVLSPEAKISLLTASPGEELYSTFGHNGIRIKDPLYNMDIVFNYGTFDFYAPGFYMKFARGKLNYMLSVEDFEQFNYSFTYENRAVYEQVLNLTPLQRQRVFELLLENYKPQNRYYKYDFFFDNCATRIRDIMVKALGDSLNFNFSGTNAESRLTFRDLIDLYLTEHPWSDFGIDMGLGSRTDRVADPEEYLFLPDFLMRAFSFATIRREGKDVPFVSLTQKIIDQKPSSVKEKGMSPNMVTWLFFVVIIVLTIWGFRQKRRLRVVDITLFSIIGFLGWFIFALWFLTDHVSTKANYNLLWAFPLHLPLMLIYIGRTTKFARYYRLISSLVLILIIAFWWTIPQQFHVAIIPVLLAIIVRLLYNQYFHLITSFDSGNILKRK